MSGGALAIEFALNHADQLNTLILVDSAPVEGVFTPLETLIVLEKLKTDRHLLRQALAALMPTFPSEPILVEHPVQVAPLSLE